MIVIINLLNIISNIILMFNIYIISSLLIGLLAVR